MMPRKKKVDPARNLPLREIYHSFNQDKKINKKNWWKEQELVDYMKNLCISVSLEINSSKCFFNYCRKPVTFLPRLIWKYFSFIYIFSADWSNKRIKDERY